MEPVDGMIVNDGTMTLTDLTVNTDGRAYPNSPAARPSHGEAGSEIMETVP